MGLTQLAQQFLGMALAYDTDAGVIVNSGTVASVNITTAGTNEIILIGILDVTRGGLSAITVGGSAATLVNSLDLGAGNGFMYMYNFVGATGTQSISVTRNTSSTSELGVLALAYTGASQTGQTDSNTTNSASATSITTSSTSVADNSWHVQWAVSTGSAITAGTGTTDRTGSLISAGQKMGDNNAAIHPAGSNSMQWNQTSGSPLIGVIAATIKPVAAAASRNSNFFAFM